MPSILISFATMFWYNFSSNSAGKSLPVNRCIELYGCCLCASSVSMSRCVGRSIKRASVLSLCPLLTSIDSLIVPHKVILCHLLLHVGVMGVGVQHNERESQNVCSVLSVRVSSLWALFGSVFSLSVTSCLNTVGF